MRFGICTGVGSIPDAAEAGYEFVELMAGDLLPDRDEAAFAPVRKALLSAPLRAEAFNCFLPGHLKVAGPDVDMKGFEKHATVVMSRISSVGGSILVFGSGGSRRVPEGFPMAKAWEQFAASARLAGDIAARYDITIAMEPLFTRSCNLLNLVEEGIRFVDRVDHPRVRLLADLFHVTAESEPFGNIAAAGARLAHVHLATPSLPETSDRGTYDFHGYLAAIVKSGYNGRLSVEDNPGVMSGKQPPFTLPYRAMLRHVKSCLPSAGRTG